MYTKSFSMDFLMLFKKTLKCWNYNDLDYKKTPVNNKKY